MDDKEPKRRQWSARTLYRELTRFLGDVDQTEFDLDTVDELLDALRAEIVAEAIR